MVPGDETDALVQLALFVLQKLAHNSQISSHDGVPLSLICADILSRTFLDRDILLLRSWATLFSPFAVTWTSYIGWSFGETIQISLPVLTVGLDSDIPIVMLVCITAR